jgi:hypothetical protein
MRKTALLLTAAAVLTGLVAATRATPAPAPAGASDKWEYCEVQFTGRERPVRPPPGGAPAPAANPAAVRFIGPDGEELEAATWEEMAQKLKAPDAKTEATEAAHRVRVLNQLGSQGWELVASRTEGSTLTGNTTWTFKRKAAR